MNNVTPNGASRKVIETYASEMAEAFGYQAGDDLRELVVRLGGKVVETSPDEWAADGSLTSKGDGSFIVFLSPFTTELRDRFTIAHELGHLFLHAEAGRKPLKVARSGSGRPEWEANWFAAGFLMPAKAFIAKAREHASELYLSAHFQVSCQAVKIRKQTLGI